MQFATWIHTEEVFNEQQDWQQQMARLQRMGVSMLFPYISDLEFPLHRLGKAAHDHGLVLHPWIKPTFAVKDLHLRDIGEQGLKAQQEKLGVTLLRACMNDPHNTGQGLANIQSMINRHAGSIDGIHLDYVRNDNALFLAHFPCQCMVCQDARMPWLGHGMLTSEDMQDPSIMYKELELRNRSTTAFVQQVRAITRKAGLQLSLAARANYLNQPDIKEPPVYGLGPAIYEGQDWVSWAQQGFYDFICTMNYHTCPTTFQKVAEEHARLLEQTPATFFSGIGVDSSMGHADPNLTQSLIRIAADAGAEGCSLFHWGAVGDEYGVFA